MFERQTHMNLLGTVNMLAAPRLDLKTLFSNKLVDNDLEIFKQLMRDLRTKLLKITRRSKVIMFVGSQKQEGKTLLISSLAYSFHMIGKKVLMVDANFRNNGLTRQFGVKPTLGYGLQIENIESLVKNTQVPGIDLIGNMNGDYSPAEVLARCNFVEYLETLRSSYDYILIESSSVGLHSDAKEMDDMVDLVVAVFSATDQISNSDKEKLKYFELLGPKFAGAILNKVEPEYMDEVIGTAPAKESMWSQMRKFSFRNFRKVAPSKLDYQVQ
jgi:Mrp family chromosome partitioning ATPase